MKRAFVPAVACTAMALFAQIAPVVLVKEPRLATDPAVSADGRWLAYASDRGGSKALNLWIVPLEGGEARRLTEGTDDEREPAFSPDGTILAYRGDAGAGGIYLVPASGGKPRFLARGGRRPRFSPDGQRIAYWTSTGIFLVDAAGGQPRAFQPGFHSGSNPVWSPDGKRLMFAGCKDSSAASCDWWVSPTDDGEPVAVGMAKISLEATPDLWLAGDAIVFTAMTGGKARLEVLNLIPNRWNMTGKPQPLTLGDGDERSPAVGPDGQIVYSGVTKNVDIWSLSIDADRAMPNGELKRLTNDPSLDQRPSLSLDGTKMAWETSRGGNFEVWVKDLVAGTENGITNGPLREHMPALSRDGSKLVYDAHDGEKVTVFETGFQGGEPVKIAEENIGQGSFQWMPKGDAVLYFHREPPGTVGLINLKTKERTVLLRHPKLNLSLADARISPDRRWIAFPVPFAPHRSRLAVAKINGKVIEDEKDWTYVTPESFNASQPEWSPNGRWLYFLSDQAGALGVWALSVSGGRAEGTTKSILSFPSASLNIGEMRPRDIGLSVAKDKLALAVTEYTGMLWSAQR